MTDSGPSPISLKTLGWNSEWQRQFDQVCAKDFQPGRVAVEDKHHFVVFTADGVCTAQVTGKVLHQARSTAELPKVGDWVSLALVPEEGKGMIHHVLLRKTKLSRKIPGRQTREQVLVANVDIAFVVQALDDSFNPALLQRHLVMAVESGVKPVVVLNKADLCNDILAKLDSVERVSANVPVIAVSAKTGQAMESLTQLVRPGETVVFIGASGVGKSSLINQIYGDEIQATTEVRESDSKGRHTTSWREMIVMPSGGVVIDTPGMREFQMWLAGEGLREAFGDIEALALKCHFPGCRHSGEKRCAVQEAVNSGQLSRQRYADFVKLQRELAFLDRAAHQRERMDRKRRK